MKCDNCDSEAKYEYGRVPAVQYFCKPCVPWSLQPRLKDKALQEVYVPPVEEPVVEEVAPAPVKKPRKKKAVAPPVTEEG